MLTPLKDLFRFATLEWNPTEKCIRLLKWAEALAAMSAANFVAIYISAPKLEPRLERELRATARAVQIGRRSILHGLKRLGLWLSLEHWAVEVGCLLSSMSRSLI